MSKKNGAVTVTKFYDHYKMLSMNGNNISHSVIVSGNFAQRNSKNW